MAAKHYSCIFFVLFFSFYGKVIAQAPDWLWAKSIGGTGTDAGTTIALDPSGNGDVYTTGLFQGTVDFDPGPGTFHLTSKGGNDVFISKLDGLGNFVWAIAMGGTSSDFVRSIAVDPKGSGEVYITGYFQGTVDFDPGAGTYNLNSSGLFDNFIAKFDGSGYLLWARAFGGTGNDFSRSIAIDPSGSGDVYTTGGFVGTADFDPGVGVFNLTSQGDMDVFYSKLDNLGNFVWAKSMGGTGYDYSACMVLDPSGSGDIYTTGRFDGTIDFDPGTGIYELTSEGLTDIFISKLDSSGNFVWAKTLGGPDADYGWSIAFDPAGKGAVYTTGSFSGVCYVDLLLGEILVSEGLDDIFISKFDASGNFVWAKSMGGSSYDQGNSIAIDPAGSKDVYFTGYFYGTVDFDPGADIFNLTSVTGTDDIFISKLDSSGNFLWAQATGGEKADGGESLVLDAIGHLYVSGYFYSPSISFDSTTLTNAAGVNITRDIFIAKLGILSSGTISPANNLGVSVSPNPATNAIQIDFGHNPFEPFYLSLTDPAGRVVITKKTTDTELNVSHLPPGLYFLKIQNEEGMDIVKLLKQ